MVLVDEKDQTFYMVMKVKNSKLRLLRTWLHNTSHSCSQLPTKSVVIAEVCSPIIYIALYVVPWFKVLLVLLNIYTQVYSATVLISYNFV